MDEHATAPDWIVNEVLPHLSGRVRSLQMLNDKSAVVFGTEFALVAERGLMSGVRLYRVDYPPGFLLNGAKCPHCDEIILEPVGKVARLASEGRPGGGRGRDVSPPRKRRK